MDRNTDRFTSIAITVVASGIVFWIASKYWYKISSKFKRKFKPRSWYSWHSLESLENAQWEHVGQVDKLWIYPIKSFAGVPVDEAIAERAGLKCGYIKDRSLLIVDENGTMITGRKETVTVLIKCSFDANANSVTMIHDHLQPLKIDLSYVEIEGHHVKCRLWGEEVSGLDCGDEVSDWLELAVGKKSYRLVYHGQLPPTREITHPNYPLIRDVDAGLYSDLSGHMLMTEASILDLKTRVPTPCPIATQNFRPGILVRGCQAYDEDDWLYIKIGDAIFRNLKPCTRCVFVTIDHETGKRHPQMEPLKTLKRYRCFDGNPSPYFGINLGVDKSGKIRMNDKVYVLRN